MKWQEVIRLLPDFLYIFRNSYLYYTLLNNIFGVFAKVCIDLHQFYAYNGIIEIYR